MSAQARQMADALHAAQAALVTGVLPALEAIHELAVTASNGDALRPGRALSAIEWISERLALDVEDIAAAAEQAGRMPSSPRKHQAKVAQIIADKAAEAQAALDACQRLALEHGVDLAMLATPMERPA